MTKKLDLLIVTNIGEMVKRLNHLIDSGVNKDKIKEFMNYDIEWITKVTDFEGYDKNPYIDLYKQCILIVK